MFPPHFTTAVQAYWVFDWIAIGSGHGLIASNGKVSIGDGTKVLHDKPPTQELVMLLSCPIKYLISNTMEKQCRWCGKSADDSHHLFRRSADPSLIDDENNKINLCRICHEYATKHKVFEELLQQIFFLRPEIKLTLKNIAQTMVDQSVIAPRDITRFRQWLAGDYAFVNEELTQLEMQEPMAWEKIRSQEGVKSDTRATKLLAMSELGLKINSCRKRLRTLEKMMSALKGLIDRINNESFNAY